MKVEMDDLKTHLDLISAEAEELNQTVINVREEKNKLSADKAALENGIEGSRLAVVKLQAEVNGVRQELNITKSENEALKDNSKSRDELVVRSQEEYTELRSDSAKALELEKLTSQKKVGEISLIVDSKIAELSSLSAELDQVKKELSRMMEGSSGQNIELEEKEKLCRSLQEELEKLKNESMKIQYSEARLIEDLKAAVEHSKVQHLDDEMKIKYTEEKLIKAESEVICKDVLLGEMVCQLGAASDNESVWNENVEKLRGDYEALQGQLVQEESIQKAAIETLEEKVRSLENERSELCTELELAGRQSEEFKLQVEARIDLCENENALLIELREQLQSKVDVQEEKICQLQEEKKRLQIEIEFLRESIEDFKDDNIINHQ